MAKRWRKYIAALGFGIFLLSASPASAMETYYLNNDPTLPMIQNTGGTDSDGHTGLFMDLSTLSIEGIFKDGLAAKVNVLDMEIGKLTESRTLHVRYADTGKAWVLRTDGKWQETSEGAEDPASMAVHFVKQEMGNDARRDEFMTQIEKIALENPGEPPSIVPADAVPLGTVETAEKAEAAQKVEKTEKTETPKAAPAAVKPRKSVVKQKKTVVRKETKPKEEVVVTITEAPKVEITPEAPAVVTIQ